jgi:uncharacterized membrane protein YjdF
MLKKAFGLSVLVLVVHFIAIRFGLYYSYVNFDSVMHFTGGLAMGMFGIAIQNSVRSSGSRPFWFNALFVLGFALTIGVFWEFYEYLMDHFVYTSKIFLHQPSVRDTMGDLLADTIGAITSTLIFIKNLKK